MKARQGKQRQIDANSNVLKKLVTKLGAAMLFFRWRYKLVTFWHFRNTIVELTSPFAARVRFSAITVGKTITMV